MDNDIKTATWFISESNCSGLAFKQKFEICVKLAFFELMKTFLLIQ